MLERQKQGCNDCTKTMAEFIDFVQVSFIPFQTVNVFQTCHLTVSIQLEARIISDFLNLNSFLLFIFKFIDLLMATNSQFFIIKLDTQ